MRQKPGWEIDVVVAEKGTPAILGILEDMHVAVADWDESQWGHFLEKPCDIIARTTGPVRVGKTLQARAKHGYQPHVRVFSMCRPVEDLERLISLDATGRVSCKRSDLESYDVLSAFSMSYRSNPQTLPPVAAPRPRFVHLRPPPPLPDDEGNSNRVTGLDDEVKRRRVSGKRPERKGAETALVGATQPDKCIDEQMQPGYQPHEQLHQSCLTQVERSGLDDMTTLFLTQRKCASVNGVYYLLQEKTREHIRSFRDDCY